MSWPARAILLLAAASDVALVAWMLLRARERPLDLRRVGRTALVCTYLLVLQWLAVMLTGPRFFLMIHVGYVMAMVGVPAAALVVLAQRRRRVTRAARAFAAAALLVVPVGLYATFVEPQRLVLERATIAVPAGRALAQPLRIGVLADVQCARVTDRERAAVARVMAERPDLILLPGDLMQLGTRPFEDAVEEFRALLRPLEAPLGVYFALGNTDSPGRILRTIAGTRVELLQNEVVRLRHGGRDVLLGGVDLSFRSPEAAAVLEQLERAPGNELRLLAAHRPDVMLALESPSRVDLVVAGHTHGGQVVVPGLGPPMILSSVPRSVGAGGFHERDGRRIYVSRGIGVERDHAPRVRLFCPPEVSLLTLVPAAEP